MKQQRMSMEVGTIVYLRWYDFSEKTEYVLKGEVADNSVYSETQWKYYVNVRFKPPYLKASVCQHFLPEKLSADANNVPHDDCYLVCGKKTRSFEHDVTVRLKNTEKLNVSDAWQRVQEFKQEHWDYQHGHLSIDKLDEYYQLWRDAIAAKLQYREYPKHPYVPEFGDWNFGIQHEPIAPFIAEAIAKAKEIRTNPSKKEQRSTGRILYKDTIQTSLFD